MLLRDLNVEYKYSSSKKFAQKMNINFSTVYHAASRDTLLAKKYLLKFTD